MAKEGQALVELKRRQKQEEAMVQELSEAEAEYITLASERATQRKEKKEQNKQREKEMQEQAEAQAEAQKRSQAKELLDFSIAHNAHVRALQDEARFQARDKKQAQAQKNARALVVVSGDTDKNDVFGEWKKELIRQSQLKREHRSNPQIREIRENVPPAIAGLHNERITNDILRAEAQASAAISSTTAQILLKQLEDSQHAFVAETSARVQAETDVASSKLQIAQLADALAATSTTAENARLRLNGAKNENTALRNELITRDAANAALAEANTALEDAVTAAKAAQEAAVRDARAQATAAAEAAAAALAAATTRAATAAAKARARKTRFTTQVNTLQGDLARRDEWLQGNKTAADAKEAAAAKTAAEAAKAAINAAEAAANEAEKERKYLQHKLTKIQSSPVPTDSFALQQAANLDAADARTAAAKAAAARQLSQAAADATAREDEHTRRANELVERLQSQHATEVNNLQGELARRDEWLQGNKTEAAANSRALATAKAAAEAAKKLITTQKLIDESGKSKPISTAPQQWLRGNTTEVLRLQETVRKLSQGVETERTLQLQVNNPSYLVNEVATETGQTWLSNESAFGHHRQKGFSYKLGRDKTTHAPVLVWTDLARGETTQFSTNRKGQFIQTPISIWDLRGALDQIDTTPDN